MKRDLCFFLETSVKVKEIFELEKELIELQTTIGKILDMKQKRQTSRFVFLFGLKGD